ncbi:hypothetical protein C0J52_18947 [Blattella germanica]|nr:hypothetical protein C0J52_18947 [Blattella germanica]
MDQWPIQIRIQAVEAFIRLNSVIAAQRFLRQGDRHLRVPDRRTIVRWVQSWREHGKVENKKSSGRPRTVRTPENINRVRAEIQQSPQRSARRHSLTMQISRRSLHRILKSELKFHPYKLQVVHKLRPNDRQMRMTFCAHLQEMIAENNILPNLLMSDETHFHLTGFVNKQNFRYWSDTNPHLLHETPLHSPKVTVWCGVAKFGIIGPYFFQDLQGRTVTVNSERYLEMINTFLVPELRRMGHLDTTWFQQDGATAHTAINNMNRLRQLFPRRLISRFGDIQWPSRSPDLSAPDFFLWGYLKKKVFSTRKETLAELRASIRNEIAAIPRDMLASVMDSFLSRLHCCEVNEGGHLLDVIFRK